MEGHSGHEGGHEMPVGAVCKMNVSIPFFCLNNTKLNSFF